MPLQLQRLRLSDHCHTKRQIHSSQGGNNGMTFTNREASSGQFNKWFIIGNNLFIDLPYLPS
jgi:hypothetical protein